MENEESSGDELMQIDMDSKEITQGFMGIAKQISMEDDTDDSSQDPDPERLLRPIRHKRATTSGDSMETDEDDDDDDEDDEDKGHILDGSFTNPLSNIDNMINVGTDYQAVIEPSVEKEEVVEKEESEEEERETKIWESPENIDDEKLTGYIDEATGRFRLPIDRALYILQEEDFKFDVAIFEASNRRELKDVWSPVEISLFQTCFLHFGKRFKKIQAAMPTRSLGQIIQYYYDTKKTRNYKMTINCHLNETDTYDELFKEIDEFERVPAGYCENCNMKSQVLIMNSIMKRHECKPCILYFRLMRIPRPASLRQKVARHHRVACPEYMKNYVADYVDMISPGDGNAIKRLGIGKVKEPEDEDCVVVDESPLRRPSAPYIVETGEFDDPVDSNTCRNTRVFLGEGNRSMIENIRKKHHLAVPLVWRQKQNKAMEDVEVLNEAARRKMYDATVTLNRVKNADVKQWAADMEAMKFRMQRAANEDDGPGGTRSGKVRMDQNWTPEEKKDVVRCFHWYFDNFELISEIMLTKTPEQVRNFYMDNEKLLVQSIDAYRTEIRERLSQIRRDA